MDSIIIKVIVIVNTNQWYPHHIKLNNIAADINIIVFFVLAVGCSSGVADIYYLLH